MARILIVDDDRAFAQALSDTLASLGHESVAVHDGDAGLAALQPAGPARGAAYALAFIDHRMPGLDGLDLLRTLAGARRPDDPPAPPIVMLTAHASSRNTIDAMKHGAFDHLAKPVGRAQLIDVLDRALRAPAPPAKPVRRAAPEPLIGASAAMREVHKRIGLAARSDVPVLIGGETGTGKELVARALHGASERAAGPFVAINCAALPPELMESELFGHRKGAFSGAVADRAGTIRDADGGSLFLDEIGDMPLALQAKLLRVLQEREVTPLGSSKPVPVDLRLIAASHRDLAAMAQDGRFRADLLYRLNVVPIGLPPLRERVADVLPLAEHFLTLAAGAGGLPKTIAPDAATLLVGHRWPGNVRELKNLMDRCHVLVRAQRIEARDLGPLLGDGGAVQGDPAPTGSLPHAVAALERRMIQAALEACGGNRSEAAKRLGIHRQQLYRKLSEHGLDGEPPAR